MGLHRPIAHMGLGIHQDFILVDNICGDLDFEDGGNPFIMNRLFAGLDPVLIDAYVCAELHYKPEDVPVRQKWQKSWAWEALISHGFQSAKLAKLVKKE